MKNLHLINVESISPVVSFIKEQGVNVRQLLLESGLPIELADKCCNVKAVANYQYWQFLRACQKELNWPDLGYRISQSVGMAMMQPLLDTVCKKSLSLYDGLTMLIRFMSHLSTHATYELEEHEHGVWFVGKGIEIEGEVLTPLEQITINNMVMVVQYYLGALWHPSAIRQQQNDALNQSAKHFSNTLIANNQSSTGIFIERDGLGKANEKFNLENLIASSDLDIRFSQKLYKILHIYYGLGFPTIDKAAKLLGLSLRQIQRRLVKEKVSYRKILNQVKFDLACEQLSQNTLKIIEISQRLDYNDASHFARAFKKLSGISPKQYRAASNHKKAFNTEN